MDFYVQSAATALALIKRFGRRVSIERREEAYNPVTGVATLVTLSQGFLDTISFPASKGTVEAFDNRLVDDLIAGRLRFILAAAASAPFEPLANDTLTFDNSVWVVLGSTPLAPAGTPLLYKLGCRKQ